MKPSEILSKEIIEPTWIVKDMIPLGTMIVLAGEAGAGKSYLCYALMYAIAANQSFLGHATIPTRVLYFDEENAEPDFLQYNQWAWAASGSPPMAQLDPLLRVEHFSLLGGWKEVMGQAIQEHKPGLVIIDTATPALHIQDENDNAEASRAIQTLRALRQAAGHPITFIVLKHERQRDDTGHRRTIRGAKVWLGAFDQVLFHVIAPGARRRKDGTRKTRLEPDKLRAFALDHVIEIDPEKIVGPPNSLILHAKPLYAKPETDSA